MLLSGQLAEASGAINPSDDEILSVAAEVAQADPKKRFSATMIRERFAKRAGAAYVIIEPSVEKRLKDLVAKRKIVADRARGFFKFIKMSGDASGLAFRNAGNGGFDVLLAGEWIGSIEIGEGEFVGASRQREKVYVVDIDVEGHDFTGRNAPPEFKKLTDAKKWLKARLG